MMITESFKSGCSQAKFHLTIFNRCFTDMETNHLICIANQLTGFNLSRTLTKYALKYICKLIFLWLLSLKFCGFVNTKIL